MTNRVDAGQNVTVRFKLNGRDVEARTQSRTLLTDFLRHHTGATGTHVGCEHGVCGACTIRVNGSVARACLMLAVQVEGAQIETVEALGEGPGALSVLQQSFVDHHGLQCGFCTPGILMTLDTLLTDEPNPSDERIREALGGHLCRCTGYEPIMRAACAARDTLNNTRS